MKRLIYFVLIAIASLGVCLVLSGCASLNSDVKDFEADTIYLTRHVVLYDCTGEHKLWEFTGDCRIAIDGTTGKMIAITTKNGKRYNINGGVLFSEEL